MFKKKTFLNRRNLHISICFLFQAGCVRFHVQSTGTKIILLMYSAKKKSFIGLIPNDQNGIVQGIKTVVARYRQKVSYICFY